MHSRLARPSRSPSSAPRAAIAAATLAALAALAWSALAPSRPLLVYNPSNSVAIGWYHIHAWPSPQRELQVGDVVLARLPPPAAALAAQRHYLPLTVPVLKPVAAVAPQLVCVSGGVVRIDGAVVARTLNGDRRGRPLASWNHCRRLHAGEVFLLATPNPASYDSRYFGPIKATEILGLAQPWQLKEPS